MTERSFRLCMAKTCLYVGSTSLCQLHDVALTPDIAVTPSRLCYPFPFNDDARREQDYLPTANDDSEPFHPRGIPIARGRAATLEDISERTLLTKHVPPIPHIHEDIDKSVRSNQSTSRYPRRRCSARKWASSYDTPGLCVRPKMHL